MSYTPASSGPNKLRDDAAANNSPVVDWDRIIHKNVRGSDNEPIGKVIAVPDDRDTIILTSQGSRGEFEIPKSKVQGFNGAEVILELPASEISSYKVKRTEAHEAQEGKLIEEEENETSKRTTANTYTEPSLEQEQTKIQEKRVIDSSKQNKSKEGEKTIPVMEEKLDVSKRASTDQATIVKEPVTETRTVEVPVTHEEVRVERRTPSTAASNSSMRENNSPVESQTEIKIPLKSEEVQVTKQPYVKEEVVVKKEPVTETRTVSDTVRSEKVRIEEPQADQRTTED
jgi:uncharacterized protein (TIGR02271 family)